jgi:xylitol oxidase
MIDLKNWAGNHRFAAASLHAPRSLDELRTLVKHSTKLKAIGTRHSFNTIADTSGDLISLEHFDQIDEPDQSRMTVTLGAGVRYGELATFLDERGYALPNLASLPHISVAGACATATHGSGDRNGNLATIVRAMQLVTADGKVRKVSRDTEGDRFNGMVVHLGALGIVTRLTLDIVPTFNVLQHVYERLPLEQLELHFDAITSSAYSVSLFTDWASESINQVWVKQRMTDPGGLDPRQLGATLAGTALHPIASCSPVNCTEQLGVSGPWHGRLPHFRMEFTPSAGDELQTEYFVARRDALSAISAIHSLRSQITPHLQISEIRTIASDHLWLSPCHLRDSVGIHFTWKPEWPAVRQLLPKIEQRLARFGARPHWGKLFSMNGTTLASRYPMMRAFRMLVQECDPDGKFHSDFLGALELRR